MDQTPQFSVEKVKRSDGSVSWKARQSASVEFGPARNRTFTTKAAADQQRVLWRRQWEEVRTQRKAATEDNDFLAALTLRDYYVKFRSEIYGDRSTLVTQAGYDVHWRKRIEPALGDRAIGTITRKDLRTFLGRLDCGKSVKRGTNTVAGMIMAHAFNEDVIPANPALKLVGPAQAKAVYPRDVIEFEDVFRLADAIDEHYHFLVILLAFSGLRISEALALTWADIRAIPAGIEIDVHKQYGKVGMSGARAITQDKSRRPRLVAVVMNPRLKAAMERHVMLYGNDRREFIFRNPQGTPTTYEQFRKNFWVPANEVLDMSRQVHELRHTAISFWIRCGYRSRDVSDWAGHASTSFTERTYVHFFKTREHDRLSGRHVEGHDDAYRDLTGEDPLTP